MIPAVTSTPKSNSCQGVSDSADKTKKSASELSYNKQCNEVSKLQSDLNFCLADLSDFDQSPAHRPKTRKRNISSDASTANDYKSTTKRKLLSGSEDKRQVSGRCKPLNDDWETQSLRQMDNPYSKLAFSQKVKNKRQAKSIDVDARNANTRERANSVEVDARNIKTRVRAKSVEGDGSGNRLHNTRGVKLNHSLVKNMKFCAEEDSVLLKTPTKKVKEDSVAASTTPCSSSKHSSMSDSDWPVQKQPKELYTKNQDVLGRWHDGLHYEGKINHIKKTKSGQWMCSVKMFNMTKLEDYNFPLKDVNIAKGVLASYYSATGQACPCAVCGELFNADNSVYECDNCLLGYHATCHKPEIPTNDLNDSNNNDSWYCRDCVLSELALRKSGAQRADEAIEETGEDSDTGSGEIDEKSEGSDHNDSDVLIMEVTEEMKRKVKSYLLYEPSSLTWYNNHKKNREEVYCYCGGSAGQYMQEMIQCWTCRNWFHQYCTDVDLCPPFLTGDRNHIFLCQPCYSGGGEGAGVAEPATGEYIQLFPWSLDQCLRLLLYHILAMYNSNTTNTACVWQFIQDNYPHLNTRCQQVSSIASAPELDAALAQCAWAKRTHRGRWAYWHMPSYQPPVFDFSHCVVPQHVAAIITGTSQPPHGDGGGGVTYDLNMYSPFTSAKQVERRKLTKPKNHVPSQSASLSSIDTSQLRSVNKEIGCARADYKHQRAEGVRGGERWQFSLNTCSGRDPSVGAVELGPGGLAVRFASRLARLAAYGPIFHLNLASPRQNRCKRRILDNMAAFQGECARVYDDTMRQLLAGDVPHDGELMAEVPLSERCRAYASPLTPGRVISSTGDLIRTYTSEYEPPRGDATTATSPLHLSLPRGDTGTAKPHLSPAATGSRVSPRVRKLLLTPGGTKDSPPPSSPQLRMVLKPVLRI